MPSSCGSARRGRGRARGSAGSATAAAIASLQALRPTACGARIGAGPAPSSWSRRAHALLVDHVRHHHRGHAGPQRRRGRPRAAVVHDGRTAFEQPAVGDRADGEHARPAAPRRAARQSRGAGLPLPGPPQRLRSPAPSSRPGRRRACCRSRRTRAAARRRGTRAAPAGGSGSSVALEEPVARDVGPAARRARARDAPPGCRRTARASCDASSWPSGSRSGSGGSPASRRSRASHGRVASHAACAQGAGQRAAARCAGRAQAHAYERRAEVLGHLPAEQHRELVGDDRLGSLAGGERVGQPAPRDRARVLDEPDHAGQRASRAPASGGPRRWRGPGSRVPPRAARTRAPWPSPSARTWEGSATRTSWPAAARPAPKPSSGWTSPRDPTLRIVTRTGRLRSRPAGHACVAEPCVPGVRRAPRAPVVAGPALGCRRCRSRSAAARSPRDHAACAAPSSRRVAGMPGRTRAALAVRPRRRAARRSEPNVGGGSGRGGDLDVRGIRRLAGARSRRRTS